MVHPVWCCRDQPRILPCCRMSSLVEVRGLCIMRQCPETTCAVVLRVRCAQWLIRVPSSAMNWLSQAGWAGHAGAVTRLPSVTAWSMGMSA